MPDQPCQHPDTCPCDDCDYLNHPAHVTIRYPGLREKVKAAQKRKKEQEQERDE